MPNILQGKSVAILATDGFEQSDWVDEEVILSNGVVTSRKPGDIPAFNREMIDLFSKGAAGGERSER